MLNFFINALLVITWTAKKLCLLLFIVLIFGFFSQGFENASNYMVIQKIDAIDSAVMTYIRQYAPTEYNHQDISRYVALGFSLTLFFIFGWLFDKISAQKAYFYSKAESARLRKMVQENTQIPDPRTGEIDPAAEANRKRLLKDFDALDTRIEQMGSAKKQDRKNLLKDFVALKKQLEAMGRDLAFLSIDVVDSTGMKEGEDVYVVSNDFIEYRNFVETRINANNCIKSTWTPDGLMACFGNLEDAVNAAQIILSELPTFNANKGMKRDFLLRCGINVGHVFFDDTLPLEQISDRAIDIAGHMQKHAEPNTIFIAKQIIKPVDIMKGFNKTDRHVDGLDAYRWDPASKDEPSN